MAELDIVAAHAPGAIDRAADRLRAGRLVAFPTETVYGLGGNATNETAVAGIFAAKNRPSFNPLISHLSSATTATRYVTFTPIAEKLADAFWPGPMTLVLPRRDDGGLSRLVTAGLDTAAIRVPAHPIAQALLQAADIPVAAPSANRSGRISPTRAPHVAQSLDGADVMVLDGGACGVGVESTVIDASGPRPVILRPGGLDRAMMEDVIGHRIDIADGTDEGALKSPGMLSSHYAPGKPVRLGATEADGSEILLGFGDATAIEGYQSVLWLSRSGDPVEAAANLFELLHRADSGPGERIAVSPIPEIGLGEAINDRLRRAAAPRAPA